LLPGIREALQGLRAGGYRLGIVTRNSTIAVQRILGDTVLPVEGIICREDITHPKPHLDHAHAAMRLLDVQPDAAMMVGDHPTDIQMGKAAGMATVAVLTGQTGEEDLRKADPDLVLPSVMVLAERLLGTPMADSRRIQQESAAAPE
jgi:phosphoglycolate phosphatase